MSTSWLQEILKVQSLTLGDIDVTSSLITLAAKAEMVQGLTHGSIPIILPTGSNETTYSNLLGALSAGTKFWDGYLYFTLVRNSNQGVRERFKNVFVVSYGEPMPFEPLTAARIAISQILLWVTRGGLANTSSQAPLPRMIRNINQFKEGEMNTEGEYMESVLSFDPKLLNLKGVFKMNSMALGFDQVFLQRMKLSIAGHKPLKVVNDNWSLISPHLLDAVNTTPNGRLSALVNLLRTKALAGMTYSKLHPGHEDNLAQKYTGFYRTCLHSIISVMSGFEYANFDNSLAIVNSRGLFNSDPFMRRIRDQDAGVKSYQTTVESWNLTQLETDFGELWLE